MAKQSYVLVNGVWVPAGGPPGVEGPPGPGVPAGGAPDQVLTKQSGTDYDAAWETPAAGGSGGGGLDEAAADARYLQLTGGLMTGDLTTNGAIVGDPYLTIMDRQGSKGLDVGTQVLLYSDDVLKISGNSVFIQSDYNNGPVSIYGRLDTQASSTALTGLRIPHGTAPTTPVNGDVWTTTAGAFARINGTTVSLSGGGGGLDQAAADARYLQLTGGLMTGNLNFTGGTSSLGGAWSVATNWLYGNDLSGVQMGDKLTILASSTGASGLRLLQGTAPTTPQNGDMWTTTAGLYVRINGATVNLSSGGGGLDQATADARYVNVAGDQMTGDLQLSAPNGTARAISLTTGGSLRWQIGKNPVTETGGDSGSNFVFARYHDDGSYIDNAMTIDRNNAWTTFKGGMTVQGSILHVNGYLESAGGGAFGNQEVYDVGTPTLGTSAANKAYVDDHPWSFNTGAVDYTGDLNNLIAVGIYEASDLCINKPPGIDPTISGHVLVMRQRAGASGTWRTQLWQNEDSTGAIWFRGCESGVWGSWSQAATKAYVDTANNLKADLASPIFTGIPSGPTAAAATSTTQLATTAFATTANNLKANIASPVFTGVPAAPTAGLGNNTTQLATTAFVIANAGVSQSTADGRYALLSGAVMTGSLTAPSIITTTSGVEARSAAGSASKSYFNTGSSLRWAVGKVSGTESGSNAGADFAITAYSDAGAYLSDPLSITRSTGLATVKGDPTTGLGIATKQYVDTRTPKITVATTAPSSPTTGDIWVNST